MPQQTFWHVHVVDGESRQTRRALAGFETESMGGDADPQNNLHMDGARHVIVAVMPAGMEGEWHENPAPQWIVPLSGRWWVETMDGTRVEMGPGEISFGGDQGTTDGRGHRSGVVGAADCHLLIVQFDTVPQAVRDAAPA
ncbi:cupin domain-containing protein [Jannaschia ovalis]|uniref:Cupin domain-containing protein n=1 Tax=Jannaschia ovalis TaxID=3038773 RepID=A0ABY8LBL3_9RHOB|nr:cupin domain-containing protein [Jannaschia sp. GRR-S6-38]WGH77670.1 cupin domain-containing protein [Jannaschia sp. GRR-S6-38]